MEGDTIWVTQQRNHASPFAHPVTIKAVRVSSSAPEIRHEPQPSGVGKASTHPMTTLRDSNESISVSERIKRI